MEGFLGLFEVQRGEKGLFQEWLGLLGKRFLGRGLGSSGKDRKY
jgi:hypothetical protein